MTIQQCKYVLKIKEVGTFSEAARQLFIAQSGLSSSVKMLEEELNIKIFERSKNGVVLTSNGAEFVRYAEELVAQSDFVLDRYDAKIKRDRLHISTQHYDFIADVFCEFIGKCKSNIYNISLQEKRTHEVIRDVETALSDVGIIAIKNKDYEIMLRFLQTKEIAFFELLRTPPHLFVKKGHPLSEKNSIGYDDLREYPYLCYDQGKYNNLSLFTEEMQDNVVRDKQIVISDRATLMNMLLKTNAYTIGTGIMPSNLNDGKITSIPIETKEIYIVGFIVKRNVIKSKMAEDFIEMINSYSENIIKNRT